MMGRYTGSAITEQGSEGWGSKTELERIGFPANETVGQDAGNVLRRFVLRSMEEEKSSVRKCRGGVEDDTLFISLVLQYYRLCHSSMPYHPHGVPIFPSTA